MDTLIELITHRVVIFFATLLGTILGAVVAKGWLDAANASAVAETFAAAAGSVVAIALHHLVLTPTFGAAQSFLKKWFGDSATTPPTAMLLLALGLSVAVLTGCPRAPTSQPASLVPIQLTPRQQYQVAAFAYNASAIGLALAHAKGDISPSAWTTIQQEEGLVQTQLAAASQYITFNPATADTPGAPLPPLDPLNFALSQLQLYATQLQLVPLNPPTTQPAK